MSNADQPEAQTDEATATSSVQPSGFAQRETRQPDRKTVLLVTSIAAVVTFVLAAVFGGLWWSASADEDVTFVRDREAALLAGEQGVITLNTMDYRNVDKSLDDWDSVATGYLLDDFKQGRENAKKILAEAKAVSSATVREAAVTELDSRAGKASMLVLIDAVNTTEKGGTAKGARRIGVQLTKVDGVWKLNGTAPVPVGAG
ncbi:hypothetical protein D5S17_30130 [Pseudonocardiaceae bacterium YIM PH 21723]|nr:hypothetical protein D5S17_30130 [Pseudonocardiaceae bacterium YIM PH 21723]